MTAPRYIPSFIPENKDRVYNKIMSVAFELLFDTAIQRDWRLQTKDIVSASNLKQNLP